MTELSRAQAIECFHLSFLSVLPREFDQSGYVLKGGANLRYFFGSERYSEDVDLDVVRLKDWQVREKVNRALDSQAIKFLLRASGFVIGEYTLPKQTATTQRWKVAFGPTGSPGSIRTKIEFSHRDLDPKRSLDPVPEPVVAGYAIRPPMVQHYEADAALEQKVFALAARSETQARDVFDLQLLLRRVDFDPDTVRPETVSLARNRALELPYDAYRDQVLPFLEPELASLYGDPATWERMQIFVAGKLEPDRGDS